MRVLVTAASKHGSTTEIAQAIGDTLTESGHEVAVLPIEAAPKVEGHDAVVVGSAVYAGHWLPAAKEFVNRNAGALQARPVWLFSSGPVGDPPLPKEEPVDATPIVVATGAREHRVFAGRVDRHRLGLAEKAIVIALRVPDGDYRDWAGIRDWAHGIAEAVDAGA